MIRNQRGVVGVFTIALVALLALSAGVFYYVQNKTAIETGAPTDISVTSKIPKEIKNDTDASSADASLGAAAKADLGDSEATEADLGL